MIVHGYPTGHYPIKSNDPDPGLECYLRDRGIMELERRTMLDQVAFVSPRACISEPSGLILTIPYYPATGPMDEMAAVIHRVGRKMPTGDRDVRRDFVIFSKALIERKFEPLRSDEVLSFEEWALVSSYSKKDLDHLREIKRRNLPVKLSGFDLNTFIKFEPYIEDPKNPRLINAYSFDLTAHLGPLIHSVDKKTFKSGDFVKGTNPRDWPDMLHDLLGDGPVIGTDFSSFEAHHQEEFAEVTHHWMMHMIRDCGIPPVVKRAISKMMKGEKHMRTRYMEFFLQERLMSGALWTSSANGVLNLCIMHYLLGRTKYPDMDPVELASRSQEYFVGKVEGDDGICKDLGLDDSLIAKLGIDLKMDRYEHFTDASFCGIVCPRGTKDIITNPRKVLLDFFVLPIKYLSFSEVKQRTFLRGKALSYYFNYKNCPIVGPLMWHVLHCTRGLNLGSVSTELDYYKRNLVAQCLRERFYQNPPEVRMETRLLVESKFDFPVAWQLSFEAAVRSSRDLVIKHSIIDVISDKQLRHALAFGSVGHLPYPVVTLSDQVKSRLPQAWSGPDHARELRKYERKLGRAVLFPSDPSVLQEQIPHQETPKIEA